MQLLRLREHSRRVCGVDAFPLLGWLGDLRPWDGRQSVTDLLRSQAQLLHPLDRLRATLGLAPFPGSGSASVSWNLT